MPREITGRGMIGSHFAPKIGHPRGEREPQATGCHVTCDFLVGIAGFEAGSLFVPKARSAEQPDRIISQGGGS